MKEKTWLIDYSYIRKDGEVREERATVKAPMISLAIQYASQNIVLPLVNDPETYRVAIYGVQLADGEEVF